jgi:hypothetical protein
MKRSAFITATVAVLATTFLSGCLVAPVMPPHGLLFSSYKSPLFPDQTEGNAAKQSGESSAVTILYLVTVGDASLDKAVQDGRLSKVNYVDYEYMNVLGVYQHYKTIARGE